MFDYKRYLNFHKNLAERQPDLQHIDGKRIAWLGDDDAEDAQGERNQHSYMMMMVQASGEISGDDDSQMNKWRGGFELVGKKKKAGAVDFRADEEVANEAWRIGRNIIDKINAISNGDDCEEEDCRCVIGAFNLSTVRWQKINYKATHIGFRFTYEVGEGTIHVEDDISW